MKVFDCGILLMYLVYFVIAQQSSSIVETYHNSSESKSVKMNEATTTVCAAQGIYETPLIHWEFKKINGALFLRLRIKDFREFKKVVGDKCFGEEGSLVHWHIHTKASFSGGLAIGQEACAPTFTGGHVDPGLACGPSSGNLLCKSLNIPPSSALNNSSSIYTCTPKVYSEHSSFACEAGDLAGKYGGLFIPPMKKNSMTFTLFIEDLHDGLNPCELMGTSLVVHCGTTTTRALCMKLDVKTETHELFYVSLRKYTEELTDYEEFVSHVFDGGRSSSSL